VRDSAWSLAPLIVLVVGLSLARGETVETDAPWNPWWLRVVTQAPITMPLSKTSVVPPSDPVAYPPSGVLPAPPAAPNAVPASGVLPAPLERRTITTTSVKLVPSPRSAGAAAHTRRMARRFVPRRNPALNPTKQKREDVAGNTTSTRPTGTMTQHVATATTVPSAERRRYFNYVALGGVSRSSARVLSANRGLVVWSPRPVEITIAVGPTRALPLYNYVYETDRILVIDPQTGIAVRAIPR
jgi:hypothetical protein